MSSKILLKASSVGMKNVIPGVLSLGFPICGLVALSKASLTTFLAGGTLNDTFGNRGKVKPSSRTGTASRTSMSISRETMMVRNVWAQATLLPSVGYIYSQLTDFLSSETANVVHKKMTDYKCRP